MAINRYDQPAQAQFMNTYVPIPFDEMSKMGMMRQQMVERNDQSNAEISASLNSFQVAPFDEKNLQMVQKEYQSKLNDAVSQSGMGNYETTRNLMNLRSQMAADPRLKNMSYNYGMYGEYQKRSEEATKADATAANTNELQSSLKDIYAQGGTLGLMSTGRSGKWSPGNWYNNKDVDAALEKSINNVVSSSEALKTFKADPITGKPMFVVSSEEGGRTLSALGAPFGIKFSPKTNSNGVTTMQATAAGMTQEGVQHMNDFMETAEGQQLIRDGQLANPSNPMQYAQDKYLRKVTSVINQYVSHNSKYSIDYDPLYEASAKKDLADQAIPFVQRAGMGVPAAKFKSAADVNNERQRVADMSADVDKRRNEYIESNGIRKETNQYLKNGQPVNVDKEVDQEGRNVGLMLQQFDAEKQQADKNKNDLDQLWNKAVDATKGPDGRFLNHNTWNPEKGLTPEQIASAKDKAMIRINAEQGQTASTNVIAGGGGSSPEGYKDPSTLPADLKATYNDYYNQQIAKMSPIMQAVNETLKKNAAASVQEVGITNLPSKTSNDYMEKMFVPWVVEGGTKNRLGGSIMRVRSFKTGEEVTDKKELKSYTGAQFVGMTYDPIDHTPQLVYRPFTTGGGYVKGFQPEGKQILGDHDIMIDAPEGVEAEMVRSGWTNELEVSLRHQLVDMHNTSSSEGTLGGGNTAVKIRELSNSERSIGPSGTSYVITAYGEDPDTHIKGYKEYPFGNENDAVKWYTRNYLPLNMTQANEK